MEDEEDLVQDSDSAWSVWHHLKCASASMPVYTTSQVKDRRDFLRLSDDFSAHCVLSVSGMAQSLVKPYFHFAELWSKS